jgi:hypothetical protein
LRGSVHLRLVLGKEVLINGNLWRCQGRRCDKLQSGVANKLASEPQEGLLEVVVRLGRDVVVLEVLLAVEGDGLCFDLTFLYVDLVSGKNNGDVLADTDKIACDKELALRV